MSAKSQLDRFAAALQRRREKAALEKARNSFEAYCQAVWPGYRAARHHRFIIAKCEGIERGEQLRTMISCPPQHGKSLTASHLFACWLLGRDPSRRVVIASYGDDRVGDLGRAVLRTLTDPKHLQIFPQCQVDPSAASTSRIELLRKDEQGAGAFYAVSRNGTLTGRPCDYMLLDDLLKDDKEAKSPAVCREVIQFYTRVALTRLGPTGAILLIGTRWGNLDLFNYLLTEQHEDRWDVVNLPAFAGPDDLVGRREGEALWPEKYPEHILQQRRAEMGGPAFTCLYQCDPTAAEGTIFHPEHWQYYSVTPERFKQLIAVIDPASKTAVTNDFSVLQIWGETATGFYLLHNFRARLEYTALRRTVLEFCESWKPRSALIEDSSNGAALIQELRSTTSLPIKALKPDRSKEARAESITPLIESGRVYLPQTAPWLNDFLDEVHAFPRGAHDDQVDCLVYALMHFRDGQGSLRGWCYEAAHKFAELRKHNPGTDPVELALKNGLVPGVPLHAVSLAEAQMRAAADGVGAVQFKRSKHVFGELERNVMQNNHVTPHLATLPDICPRCGDTGLAKYDSWRYCARCQWDSRKATLPAPEPKEPELKAERGMSEFLLAKLLS